MEIDMELSIQDLGALGEFVGAIAVVVTLMYLVVQLKQNTKSVRASTHQSIAVAYVEVLQTLEDPGFSPLSVKGASQYSDLVGEKQLRFNAFCLRLFRIHEDAYFQWRNGNYDERAWASNETFLLDLLSMGGLGQWFESRKPWFNQEFILHVSGRLDNHSVVIRPEYLDEDQDQ